MSTLGKTGGGSQHTINYDDLYTTTLFAYRKTMVDNIFKDSAYLALLRQTGAKVSQNGGERIAIPLMYGQNDTVKTYGGYETLDESVSPWMAKAA